MQLYIARFDQIIQIDNLAIHFDQILFPGVRTAEIDRKVLDRRVEIHLDLAARLADWPTLAPPVTSPQFTFPTFELTE